MYFESLSVRGFRNLHAFDLRFDEAPVVLRGANGQGKTNLIEALNICATGRSFRQSPMREWAQHGQSELVLQACFVREGVRHDVTVVVRGGKRTVQVDGRTLKQRTRLLELLNVVTFFPDDLRVVKGSPDTRRQFWDRVVGNAQPAFYDTYLAYQRVLKSRNALLRASAQPPNGRLLDVYDQQLLTHGVALQAYRYQTLQRLLPGAQRVISSVLGADLKLDCALLDGLSANVVPEDYGAAFGTALQAHRQRDVARRTTTVGPHRADLRFMLNGMDARAFASQGQQRAIVLAFKLAEVRALTAALGGKPPILLLDDVSSELDSARTAQLFAELDALGGQVWVTTTGAVTLPALRQAQLFDVQAGCVSPVAVETPVHAKAIL